MGPGRVLVRTRRPLVSAGTKRMLLKFGRAGRLGKVRLEPERVAQVPDKIKTEGLLPTLQASSPLWINSWRLVIVMPG